MDPNLKKSKKSDGIVELEITRLGHDIIAKTTFIIQVLKSFVVFVLLFLSANLVMILNTISSPYTKVEESFNTQGLHDLIFTKNLKDYDHLEFSGVVERSFIGVLFVYLIGLPWFTIMGVFKLDKIYYLVFGRIILGILNYYSQQGFRNWEYIILENASFHLNFWGSRMIPNSFALLWTNLAFYFQLKNDKKSGLISLGIYVFVAVVLRAEIAVLGKHDSQVEHIGAIVILQDLYYKKYELRDGIITGTSVFLISLMCTVSVDSYFWNKWLWPELQVFLFNTYKNGSVNYGVSPYYTYFLQYLPKIAPLSYPLAIMAYFSKDAQKEEYKRILRPVFLYVFLYSFLPHKEWRFIMYTVTPLQYVASRYMKSFKSLRILYFLSLGVFALSVVAMAISSKNYPGGVALSQVPNKEGTIYIDTFTAMNGASRFGQVYPCKPWWFEQDCGFETATSVHHVCAVNQEICPNEIKLTRNQTLGIPTYDKNEKQTEFSSYLYILTNDPKKYANRKVRDVIYGYDGIGLRELNIKSPMNLNWSRILAPKVWILE